MVGVVAVVPFSMAVATISISPFSGTVLEVAKSEITVPPGARSGTLSQAERNMMGRNATDARPARPTQADDFDCASIEKPKDNNLMGLPSGPDRGAERGYAMAALLIALAIMAILLTIAMPVWRHEARREKEAELVFRGEQYARAIALFKFKNANIPNAVPPSIDFLVQNRFLRKKYKDPMTKDGEFVLIGGGSTQAGMNPAAGASQPGASQPGGPQQPAAQAAAAAAAERSVRRHDRRPQQERGNLHPLVPRRHAIRPVAVHVQHRAASRWRHADGQLARRPRQRQPEPLRPSRHQSRRRQPARRAGGFNNPAAGSTTRAEAAPDRAAAPRRRHRAARAARVPAVPLDRLVEGVGSSITVVISASTSYQSA